MTNATEVEDPELLAVPVEGVDVLVSNKAIDGKTLNDLVQMPEARGVFLRKITRGATATDIPILPSTTINRGDLFTIVGRTQDTNEAIKLLGVADRATDVADMAFVGAFIVIGALVGSLVLKDQRRAADLVDGRRRADRRDHRRAGCGPSARPSAASRRRPSGS